MRKDARADLPAGWSWSCFDAIGSVSLGRQRSPANHTGPSMRPYVRAANITWSGWDLSDVKEMNFDAADFARFRLLPGDVLINEGSGSATEVGKPAIWRGEIADCCFQNTLLRVQPRACSPEYMYSYIKSCARSGQFVASTQGVNIFHIGRDGLARHPIPVPPRAEQQRIVAKIDSLSAKSNRARRHLNHLPKLAQKFKEAVLAAAFRGELTAQWRKQNVSPSAHKVIQDIRDLRLSSDLPRKRREALERIANISPPTEVIPSGWAWLTLEEVAADDPKAIQSGPFGSSLLHSEFQSEGFLVIGIDNVQDGFFSTGSQNRISEAKFSQLERFEARPHDVLVTVMATIGRTCVVPADVERAIISKHVYRVTVDDRIIDPYYLMNSLRGCDGVLGQMGANVRGQTRPGLNGTILKSLFVPTAPLAEQQEILRQVRTAFAWIDRIAAKASQARKLVDDLDQAILSKAFSGELVPQDPNDEPSSVLLEQIKAERAGAAPARRGRGRPPLAPGS